MLEIDDEDIFMKTKCFLMTIILPIQFSALMLILYLYDMWIIYDLHSEIITISIQQESNPLLFNLKDYQMLYNELVTLDSNMASYYEVYLQYLENSGVNENLYYDYETDALSSETKAIKCIQIGKTVSELGDISIFQGRSFINSDYIYNDTVIPIIIGNNYKDIYRVGDILELNYLYKQANFEIIGVACSDTNIRIGDYTYILDDYIIMPSFDLPLGASEDDMLKIHYANKTSGKLILSKDNIEYFDMYIRPIITGSHTGNYSYNANSIDFQLNDRIGMSYNMIEKSLCMFLLVTIVLQVGLIVTLHKKEPIAEKECYLTNIRLIVSVIISLLIYFGIYAFFLVCLGILLSQVEQTVAFAVYCVIIQLIMQKKTN